VAAAEGVCKNREKVLAKNILFMKIEDVDAVIKAVRKRISERIT